MRKLLLLLTLYSIYSTNILQAQSENIEECAANILHKELMENDPIYATRIAKMELKLKNLTQDASRSANGTVYQIPVVVHVIHNGEAEGVGANISMTQINSAIDRMNNRYRNIHGSSVDTEIEFVLAQRDPNGNATTGVVRVDGSGVTDYATKGIGTNIGSSVGANQIDVKNLSRWSNVDYYNIWVVTEINDNDGLYGTQGYAYFPGANPEYDGTVIMNTCFGTTGTVNSFNNQGRTLVHELGHGFNLYHTFQGDDADPGAGYTAQCPADTDCSTGDCVSDTDPHQRASSNCPGGTNTCTGSSIDDETNNFMNYSNQSCALEFTAGQSTRMRSAIIASRPALTTSLGGTAPAASSVITATCTPTTSNTVNGFGLGIYRVNLNNIDAVSDGTEDEGDYIDHTRHQTISVEEGSSHTITIETGGANPENVVVFIDYNNDGDFLDANETVFTSTNNTTHSGTINIPSSGITTDTLLRMRVISDFVNFTISDGCYNPNYGQTEDYAIEISSTLSITDANLNNIAIYPNPTSNIINIKGLTVDANVEVFSITGQLLMSDIVQSTNAKMDVSSLSNGIYMLNINNHIVKFVKQ